MVRPIKSPIDLRLSRTRRRQQEAIPREVSDGTTTGLTAKVNELIDYLRRQHEQPGPTEGDVNLSEMYNAIDALQDKVARLETELAQRPSVEPKDPEPTVLLQEPTIRAAEVVECYDLGGNVWVGPDVAVDGMLGRFAAYCKAHPCRIDYIGSPPYVDDSVDLYIEFPSAPQYSGTSGSVSPGFQCTGVTQCPPGTRVLYFPQKHAREANDPETGIQMDGFEIGWLRMAPWLLRKPGEAMPWDGSWNEEWGVSNMRVVTDINFDSKSYKYRVIWVDPCGRVVKVSNEI